MAIQANSSTCSRSWPQRCCAARSYMCSQELWLHKPLLKELHHVTHNQRVAVDRPAVRKLDRPAQHRTR